MSLTTCHSDLPSIIDEPDGTTIRLQIGLDLDETVAVAMTLRMSPTTFVAKLQECIYNGGPTFLPDSVRITRNPNKSNADSITMVARIWESGFDPDENDISINVGSFLATIPAGSIKVAANGKTASFRGALATGGKASVVATDTGKFTVTITGVDLSTLANPDIIGFDMMGLPGTHWYFRFHFQENKAHTSYKY